MGLQGPQEGSVEGHNEAKRWGALLLRDGVQEKLQQYSN